MKVFYFTATGNSLYVAKRLGGELISIPQAMKNTEKEYEDDKIGIICPCYGFGIPHMVSEFMQKTTFKSPYIFLILTYGNMVADGVGWATRFAAKNGIELQYASSLLMIDNYLPLFDVEKQCNKTKKIEENLEHLIKNIKSGKKWIDTGNGMERIMTNGMHCMEKVTQSFNSPKSFFVNDDCIQCGICSKVCPRNNIAVEMQENKKPYFGDHCEYCLACVNLCPKKAIKIKKEKNRNARFHNQNISVKEIMEANN